ncbi:MAG TPA: FMN-binding protein [Acidimicrobiia bacterium]
MTKTRLASLLIATVGALGLLASFHTTAGTSTRTAGSATKGTTPPATTAPPPQRSTPSTAPPPPTTSTGNQTVEGSAVSTRYGDVQVRVVVSGGRLVDVQSEVLPSDRARSQSISSEAGPLLRQEALRAQSARINTVSGATYTSDGYAQSLQSALDRAGITA